MYLSEKNSLNKNIFVENTSFNKNRFVENTPFNDL